jgi:hypothetical protein
VDPDELLPVVIFKPRAHWSIKLYAQDKEGDPSYKRRCQAVLFRNLTSDEAEKKYEELNIALGHTARDVDGDLLVHGNKGPYVLID